MWIIIVTKSTPGLEGLVRKGYFPRKLKYKKDAERILQDVFTLKGIGCIQPLGGKYKQLLCGYTLGVKTNVVPLDRDRKKKPVIRSLIPLQLWESTNCAMGLFHYPDGTRGVHIIG